MRLGPGHPLLTPLFTPRRLPRPVRPRPTPVALSVVHGRRCGSKRSNCKVSHLLVGHRRGPGSLSRDGEVPRVYVQHIPVGTRSNLRSGPSSHESRRVRRVSAHLPLLIPSDRSSSTDVTPRPTVPRDGPPTLLESNKYFRHIWIHLELRVTDLVSDDPTPGSRPSVGEDVTGFTTPPRPDLGQNGRPAPVSPRKDETEDRRRRSRTSEPPPETGLFSGVLGVKQVHSLGPTPSKGPDAVVSGMEQSQFGTDWVLTVHHHTSDGLSPVINFSSPYTTRATRP